MLSGAAEEEDTSGLASTLVPVANEEVDPFDTDFAADVLPNKGDPFDTSYVKGGPGKAEIRALEEEFLTQEEFDPRVAEGSSVPKQVAPGTAGKPRPIHRGGSRGKLEIKAPPAPPPEEEEDAEEDPFDTSIVDKVIPIRAAKQRTDLSVEDDDFDPTQSFRQANKKEIDPFDTSVAAAVIPELETPADDEDKPLTVEPIEKPLPTSLTDDDFDPRA